MLKLASRVNDVIVFKEVTRRTVLSPLIFLISAFFILLCFINTYEAYAVPPLSPPRSVCNSDSANVHGVVTSFGSSFITDEGVCWSTSPILLYQIHARAVRWHVSAVLLM